MEQRRWGNRDRWRWDDKCRVGGALGLTKVKEVIRRQTCARAKMALTVEGKGRRRWKRGEKLVQGLLGEDVGGRTGGRDRGLRDRGFRRGGEGEGRGGQWRPRGGSQGRVW